MQNLIGSFNCWCHPIFTVLQTMQNAKTWMYRFEVVGEGNCSSANRLIEFEFVEMRIIFSILSVDDV